MISVIGLAKNKPAADEVVERLLETGVPGERIRILSNTGSIDRLVGCDRGCTVQIYTYWGIAIGAAIYAVAGILAAQCLCINMHYGQAIGFTAFAGALLAGALIGGLIGAVIGVAEAEEKTHLYTQGIRLGGCVIAVQTEPLDSTRVQHLLTEARLSGVKALG
jgi:branched-subunit amino acid ABC-type transport system permease component